MRLPKPNIIKPFEKTLVPRLPGSMARKLDRIKAVRVVIDYSLVVHKYRCRVVVTNSLKYSRKVEVNNNT
jgi:hypothetical protein